MKTKLIRLVCGLALLGAAASAQAAAYNWSWSPEPGPYSSFSGTLTTSDTLNNGGYLVTALAILTTTYPGSQTGTLLPVNGFLGNHNILYPGAGNLLDNWGLSFQMGDASLWNIFYTGGEFGGYLVTPTSEDSSQGLFSALSAVPEPSEWAAISFGVLGLVYVAKRRFMPARA